MTRCGTCLYWSPVGKAGQCRRYPSAVTKAEMDWCGEHSLAPVQAPIPVVDIMTTGLDKPVEGKRRGRPRKVIDDQASD